MFRYVFGDILVSMPARWNKKLMAEEKLAKIEDQEEKKKKKKGRNHSEEKNEEDGKGEWELGFIGTTLCEISKSRLNAYKGLRNPVAAARVYAFHRASERVVLFLTELIMSV